MNNKQEEVAHFIRLIRGISPQYLRYACTNGGCYRFYKVLENRFPTAKPWHVQLSDGGHVIAKIYGKYWDIWGEHIPERHGDVRKMNKQELECMSSCFFDERFVLANIDIVSDDDKIQQKKGASRE